MSDQKDGQLTAWQRAVSEYNALWRPKRARTIPSAQGDPIGYHKLLQIYARIQSKRERVFFRVIRHKSTPSTQPKKKQTRIEAFFKATKPGFKRPKGLEIQERIFVQSLLDSFVKDKNRKGK